MKPINQLASSALQNGSKPTENVQNNRLMINLWERLGYIFGHKFTSVYGESAVNGDTLTEAARTWASGLRGLTGDQIANGLRECVDCGEAWPPTLPEFVKMCKGSAKNRFGLDYIPEYHREEPIVDESRLLSSDQREASRKAGREQLDKMKSMLKGK